jgi:hypothetical protein
MIVIIVIIVVVIVVIGGGIVSDWPIYNKVLLRLLRTIYKI